MKSKKIYSALFPILTLVLLLAACSPQTGPVPGTGGEQPGLTETPVVSPELPPAAVLEAQSWLSEHLAMPIEQVAITEIEQAQWSDSCLGLGQPNESCAAVITPGWRVVFLINGQEYTVRTDETGSSVRIEEPAGAPGGETPLTGTRWQLVSFGAPGSETPVMEGSNVTLAFEPAGQAGGYGGCNSFGATYEIQGSKLSFDEIVSTLRACADQRVTQQEQDYLQALETASDFESSEDQLTIRYGDDQNVLNFVPAAPTETP